MRTALRLNLFHRHIRGTMVILEEGNLTHPWCLRCYKMLPFKALNGKQTTTAHCAKGVDKKRCSLVVDDTRDRTERAFQAYGRSLESVTSFKYMGRIMRASYDDCQSVVGNLDKEMKRWACMSRILGRYDSNPRLLGCVFQVGGVGGTNFWGRDVGDDPHHTPGPGGGFQQRVA